MAARLLARRDGVCTIGLTRGRVALVDDADWHLIADRSWFVARAGGGLCYARTSHTHRYPGAASLLHRLILSAPARAVIDHVNGDGLDNRRTNLRFCSHAENIRNQRLRCDLGKTSRFKGVWSKAGRWHAQIEHAGDRVYLGVFDDEERAALQYDRAARVFFGRFARTNEAMGLLARG